MKNQVSIFTLLVLFLLAGLGLKAQQPQSLAVLPLDAKNISYSPDQLWSIAIRNMENVEDYLVRDRYDIAESAEAENLSVNNCFGLTCLTNTGQKLGVSKVMSGTVEKTGNRIYVTLKLVDVATGKFEDRHHREFLDRPEAIPDMIDLTVREMFGLEVDELMLKQLTREDALASSYNEPEHPTIIHFGPRMGVSYMIGDNAERMAAPITEGGYDMVPVMSQIGAQLEIQYLTRGRLQGLVEMLGLGGGLDQGRFVPSFTVMNGFRDSKTGLEFAVGPTVNITRISKGFYDGEGNWRQEYEWGVDPEETGDNPYPIVERLDSRGRARLSSGLVIAAGKTFKSGPVNFPVNLWVRPARGGTNFGFTFGLNVVRG